MAQLALRLLPIPDVPSSNPVVGICYRTSFTDNIKNDKMEEKEDENCPCQHNYKFDAKKIFIQMFSGQSEFFIFFLEAQLPTCPEA